MNTEKESLFQWRNWCPVFAVIGVLTTAAFALEILVAVIKALAGWQQ